MVTVVTVQTEQHPATIVVADADGTVSTHPPTREMLAPCSSRALYLYGNKQVIVTEVASAAPAPADAPGEG